MENMAVIIRCHSEDGHTIALIVLLKMAGSGLIRTVTAKLSSNRGAETPEGVAVTHIGVSAVSLGGCGLVNNDTPETPIYMK